MTIKQNSLVPVLLCTLLFFLASCASKKGVTEGVTLPADGVTTGANAAPAASGLSFVQKVSDNQVYAKNITGSMTISVKAGGKSMSAPGALRMRKDEIIRIQVFIPLLGTEVGRLEFTPTRVLLVDRLHKEYIEADYSKIDFLKANGLDFYSLQSLFWNQLFLPGQQKVSESALKSFEVNVDETGDFLPISLKNGPMDYEWNTERATGRILSAKAVYESDMHGTSSLLWNYSDFKTVGSKSFPSRQQFTLSTTLTQKVQNAQVEIRMGDVKTSSDWDVQTTLSSKYRKVEATDILRKIISLK
ncbi:MAG: DUF4292 domain-containing protein [Prevotella sp.]